MERGMDVNDNMTDRELILQLETKIAQMEKTILSMEEEKKTIVQAIHEMYDINQQIMIQTSHMIGNITTLDVNGNFLKARLDNLRYEMSDPRQRRAKVYFPVIKNLQDTVDTIVKNKKSMARFGDGEFAQIMKMERHKFQKLDERLGIRLKEVLHSDHPNMMIAIANNYGTLQDYTEFAADGIRTYMSVDGIRAGHMELLEQGRVYYDAYVSRPYVMYRDQMTDAPRKRFENLKRIWEGRNVLIVEGAQTRMGIGNDLMEGARSIKRILAPATSSFDRYDDILKAALKHAEKDILFLVAMGPSAGVLAYDLTVEGYQALDIGHLDLEYEWFLAGKGERVAVPYKYNNELAGDDCAEELHDAVYEGQIIEDCS